MGKRGEKDYFFPVMVCTLFVATVLVGYIFWDFYEVLNYLTLPRRLR